MRDQAEDLRIGPDRLVLWGLSAGSHMTLLAAARLAGEGSPIAASVNHYPITSLEPALGTAWEHAQRLPEDPATADWAAMSRSRTSERGSRPRCSCTAPPTRWSPSTRACASMRR